VKEIEEKGKDEEMPGKRWINEGGYTKEEGDKNEKKVTVGEIEEMSRKSGGEQHLLAERESKKWIRRQTKRRGTGGGLGRGEEEN
jgi:hypothetical protein